jgi:hypothetical protein
MRSTTDCDTSLDETGRRCPTWLRGARWGRVRKARLRHRVHRSSGHAVHRGECGLTALVERPTRRKTKDLQRNRTTTGWSPRDERSTCVTSMTKPRGQGTAPAPRSFTCTPTEAQALVDGDLRARARSMHPGGEEECKSIDGQLRWARRTKTLPSSWATRTTRNDDGDGLRQSEGHRRLVRRVEGYTKVRLVFDCDDHRRAINREGRSTATRRHRLRRIRR